MSDERLPAPYTKLRVKGLSPETLEAFYDALEANDALAREELCIPPPQKVHVDVVTEYEGPIDAVLAAINTMAAMKQSSKLVETPGLGLRVVSGDDPRPTAKLGFYGSCPSYHLSQLPMERIKGPGEVCMAQPEESLTKLSDPYYFPEYRRSFNYSVSAKVGPVEGSVPPEETPETITLTIHNPQPNPQPVDIVRDHVDGTRSVSTIYLDNPNSDRPPPEPYVLYPAGLSKAEESECYAGCGRIIAGPPGHLCHDCKAPSREV